MAGVDKSSLRQRRKAGGSNLEIAMSPEAPRNDGIRKRPLSPHLQIYKIQITSLLSILHRFTGIILYGGAVLWVVWLIGLANGQESYNAIQKLLLHPIGLIVLFGWSLSFFYHFCNGIRHLCWDMGYGYDIKTVRETGWFVIVMTILLTMFAWMLGRMWGFLWI